MRVLIAGTNSNVGKTTVVLGVMRALKNRGLRVQGYKSGPDYIDTAFHTFATDVYSRNLDAFMLTEDTIRKIIRKDNDIAIIEGVMGLYDGSDIEFNGSSYKLSEITDTPIILVIDASGIAASAAAIVLGYEKLGNANIKGVIVNKVGSEYHYNLVKESIEKYTSAKCIGYLKKNMNISLKSRHLGLIPSVEVENLNNKIDEVAAMVEETIDLDMLLELSKSAKTYDNDSVVKKEPIFKIGVPMDSAFNFYYRDNLDYLESVGAELVYFSPIKDKKVPKVDGLYIGGGFPEVFAKELSANQSMLESIKKVIEKGLPTYAECGGLMYLSDSITDLEGNTFNMVGIYHQQSIMTEKLKRFGYVNVTLNQDTILGKKGLTFKAHEFHRSTIENEEENMAYNIEKNKNKRKYNGGYVKYNCLGGYPHIHFYTNLELANNFVEACLRWKNEK